MRVGTFDPLLGGVCLEELVGVLRGGEILIPHMALLPSRVSANGDFPPEIEVAAGGFSIVCVCVCVCVCV
jgi:hypothetical protein